MVAANKRHRINNTATRRIVNGSKTPLRCRFFILASQKDDAMNIWTQKSIELANQRNYLDLLYRVYPMSVNLRRELPNSTLNDIRIAFNNRDDDSLLKILLKQEVFPIKDSYVAYLKRDNSSIERNPNTAQRLVGMLYEMGLDDIIDHTTAPKETNRQIGPLFKNWIKTGNLGVPVFTNATDFVDIEQNAVFDGSDFAMESFAHNQLGYDRPKGLDFIAKFNGKYIIAEAKFLSDFGGHQNAQFNDAISTMRANLTPVGKEVIKIAILDGVLYIKGNNKMHKSITTQFSDDEVIISAVLLRDYLFSL